MYTSALQDTEIGPIILAFVAGLFATLLLISRVANWLHGLVLTRNVSRSADSNESFATWFALVFLHSGPWLLLGASWATFYLVVHVKPNWLLSLGAGACAAILFLIVTVSLSYRRQTQRLESPAPLTEVEVKARLRRSFWMTATSYGTVMSASFIYLSMDYVQTNLWFAIFILVACLSGGCLFSYFMTAWHESAIRAHEISRKRAMQMDRAKRTD